MPRPPRVRSQQHKIGWPLTPEGVANIGEMFETLFRGLRVGTDVALNPAASSITGAGDLTATNDTNVTATLTGTPTGALLADVDVALGWTGTLAVARGGIGVGTLASNGVLYGNGTGAVQALAVNATATKKFLTQTSSAAPAWGTVDAGDVASGTLAVARGGTGTGTAFTLGSVVFAGASGVYAQDNAAFFWDASNKRLGIGTAAPAATLSLNNATPGIQALRLTAAALQSAPIFVVQDSALNGLIQINADGTVQGGNGHLKMDNSSGTVLDYNTATAWQLAGSFANLLVGADNFRFNASGFGIGTTAFPSTGTKVLVFGDGTAPATMGSNTAGIYADDVAGTVNMYGIAEDGTVTRLTYGTPQTYAASNVTTDRTYDANATTLDEVADVLGTLIADLRARGQVA